MIKGNRNSSWSLLEFESTWQFTPSQAVLAAWEEVAEGQHQSQKVSVERVGEEGFNTCLAVMEELATRGLVVSKQSWDERTRGKGRKAVLRS